MPKSLATTMSGVLLAMALIALDTNVAAAQGKSDETAASWCKQFGNSGEILAICVNAHNSSTDYDGSGPPNENFNFSRSAIVGWCKFIQIFSPDFDVALCISEAAKGQQDD